MENLDFFWCEQGSITGADWSHFLHGNRGQVRHHFDLRNRLRKKSKINVCINNPLPFTFVTLLETKAFSDDCMFSS